MNQPHNGGNGGSSPNAQAAPRSLNLELLIKMLKMTTHTNDNQALIAIRKANELLEKFGGDWEALLKSKVTVLADPFASFAGEPAKPVDIGLKPHIRPMDRPVPPPPPRPAPQPTFTCVHCSKRFSYLPHTQQSLDFCSPKCRDACFPPAPKFKMPDRATQKKPTIKNL